jgi:hypothetical protein
MPFSADFDTLYEVIESLLVEHCHLKCLRADTVFGNGSITAKIWRYVNEAMFIIADLSGRNANVFYEVGLAHALGKPVVLLARDIDDVPFDLRDLMIVQYDYGAGFKAVRLKLLEAIRACAVTVPERWNRSFASQISIKPLVRISGLQQPPRGSLGQPLEIIIRARNEGSTAREGYLSVSFPEAVEDHDVSIIQTDAHPQIGRVKQSWCSGRVILEYPIAEISSAPWEPGAEHFMKVQFRSRRRGWLHYYVSASSRDTSGQWAHDPGQGSPYIDQRGEYVLCGIIDVT